MKLSRHLFQYFPPALLCFGLAGCSSPNAITPQGGGYEEVTHPPRPLSQSSDPRVSFQYHAPNGRTIHIWPSLYGVNEVVHGNLAVFVGDLAYVSANPDNPRGMKPRLFVVEEPGLPADITDEVLWQWAKAN